MTRDEFAPDDRKVFLYLQDGSYIKSFSENHHRLDSGYQVVVGEIVRPKQFPGPFDGAVRDVDIAEVKVERSSVPGTVLGCVLGGLVIAYPAGFSVGASLGWF